MKKILIILIVSAISLCLFVAYSQDDIERNDPTVPPGMVKKTVGGMTVVIPYDSWVHKQGDALILEDINAYVARKMLDVEKRLSKIEDDLEAIHKELEESRININKTK
jgi:hypothetical protein